MIKLTLLGVLIIILPIFWHFDFQNPFLFTKELLAKGFIHIFFSLWVFKYNKWLGTFSFVTLVYTVFRIYPRSQWAFVNVGAFILYYLMIRLLVPEKHIKIILRLFLASILIPLVAGWCQYFGQGPFIPHEPAYIFPGEMFKGNPSTISGFFGNTHMYTAWLGLMAPLAFAIRGYWRYVFLVGLMVSIAIFKPTLGGFTILCVGIGGFIFCSIKRMDRKIIFAIILFLSLLTMIKTHGGAFGHLMIRLRMLKDLLPYILEHPWLGHGVNAFGDLGVVSGGNAQAQAHNDYLQFYVEYGVFSLLVIPFVLVYLKKFYSLRYLAEGKIMFGIFLGFLVYATFGFPFHLAYCAILFLTIIAFCDTLNA